MQYSYIPVLNAMYFISKCVSGCRLDDKDFIHMEGARILCVTISRQALNPIQPPLNWARVRVCELNQIFI
jgi:hypothetical protein